MNVIEPTGIISEAVPYKRNNFMENGKGEYIIKRIKYLIVLEMLLGLNRLYLINRDCCFRFSYIYNSLLVLISVPYIILTEFYTASQLLYKSAVAVEYLLLAFNAMFLQRKRLNNLFTKMEAFDETLNIRNDVDLTTPMRYYFYGVFAIFLYLAFENALFFVYIYLKYGVILSIYATYLSNISHDFEAVFYSVLLVMILRRLRILKAHVAKVLTVNIGKGNSKEINKLEALSNKVDLNISALHKAYDLLYKCSEQLNYLMNFPITIMLVTAGLSTITILKNLIYVVQTEHKETLTEMTSFVVTCVGRSIKYIFILTFPCYYANVTKTQVYIIRSMLHDILNAKQLDKIEQRKLKAFNQLCHDNGFVYQLWGIIGLDMSLPLNYSSLCVTYLIIIIQFSKFID